MSDHSLDEAPLWYQQIHPGGAFTGFYEAMPDHSLVYVERALTTLVVTFDNLSQTGSDPSKHAHLLPGNDKPFASAGS